MSGLPEDGTEAPRSDPMGAAPASGPTAPSAAGAPEPPHAPSPPEFAPSRGRDCHRYRRRRVCEGPRRVPVPHGPAAERAERLGLGSRSVASRLLTGSPDPSWRAAAPPLEADAPFVWPIPSEEGRFWRGFGAGRRGHSGIDLGAAPGTLVRAARPGLVAYSDNGVRGYGNLVVLVHADGTTTWYAHHLANWVFAGERVQAGQVVGQVGETGLTHGAHLHFELRVEGVPRDPLPRFPPRADTEGR